MRRLIALAVLFVVGALVPPALAVPLPPVVLVGSLGESDLQSAIGGSFPGINVDWIVEAGAVPGTYEYFYQVENPSTGTTVDQFLVSFDTTGVTGAGYIAADDLDVAGGTPSHAAHVLAGEEDPFTLFGTAPATTTISATDITWDWVNGAGVPSGSESITLFFTSTRSPGYVFGTAHNSVPPSPWISPDLVPAAVPESASLWLLGSALAAGFIGRKGFFRT
jgi:hypothetical protein